MSDKKYYYVIYSVCQALDLLVFTIIIPRYNSSVAAGYAACQVGIFVKHIILDFCVTESIFDMLHIK